MADIILHLGGNWRRARTAAAVQSSISAIFAAGTFTDGDISEFNAALAAGQLDDVYSLEAP